MNSQVSGDQIIYKGDINLGMAVALDWGLIVPVIKNADTLSLSGLAISGQRSRRSGPYKTSKSGRGPGRNVYYHESRRFRRAVRNADHQSAASRDPLRRNDRKAAKGVHLAEGDDYIAIRQMAYFALTYDHRIVDGADAEKFLAFMKELPRGERV